VEKGHVRLDRNDRNGNRCLTKVGRHHAAMFRRVT
jgi:hypothetical protein